MADRMKSLAVYTIDKWLLRISSSESEGKRQKNPRGKGAKFMNIKLTKKKKYIYSEMTIYV